MQPQMEQLRFTLIVREKEYLLPNSPEGWENSLITVKRSETYYGMLRTFTVSMDFVLDGAWILRTEFYQFGIEGDVTFRIEELNSETWAYDNIYEGAIDFSNIKDYSLLDGYKFTCNVMQNDLTALVAAFGDTEFTIPIDVPEAVYIQYPGIQLEEQADFSFSPDGHPNGDAFPNLTIVNNRINSRDFSSQRVDFYQETDPNFSTIDKFFYIARVDGTLSMKGFLKFFGVSQRNESRINISIYKSASNSPLYEIYTQTGIFSSPEQQRALNYEIPLLKGDRLFFYFDSTEDQNQNQGIQVTYGVMTLKYRTITAPSIHKALRPDYVFQSLVNKMWQQRYPNKTYPIRSSLLTNQWNQLCITAGDAFRLPLDEFTYFDPGDTLEAGVYYMVAGTTGSVQYAGITYPIGAVFVGVASSPFYTNVSGDAIVAATYSPAAIKTSFNDFFKSINAVCCAGFAVEKGVAVLEGRSYFYQSGLQAANVGEVAKYNLSPYTQAIYNTISGGYPDQTYDTLNGRREVNSEVQFATPITRVQSEYDIKSAYRADPLGIEFLRIQYDDASVTNGDNSVFMVYVRPDVEPGQVYYQPEGFEAFQLVQGVDEGFFNLRITPKKNLLRHGAVLASFLYKIQGNIVLTSAKKNTSLVTVDLEGNRVAEADMVDIASLPTRLFIPYEMNITTALPDNTVKMLDNFPNGRIDFVSDGVTYGGFILSASVDVARKSDRELQVLLTNDNDLMGLVR